MNDRIRLAEAMGWEQFMPGVYENPTLWDAPEGVHGGMKALSESKLPDPFNSVVHDYAVLEWMRGLAKHWSGFKDELFAQDGSGKIWNYEIGDFARAALKELTR